MVTFICHSTEYQQGHWTPVVVFNPENLIQTGGTCMVAHIDLSSADRDHHLGNLVPWQSALVVKYLMHHAHHRHGIDAMTAYDRCAFTRIDDVEQSPRSNDCGTFV
jgi:hypothetical protein